MEKPPTLLEKVRETLRLKHYSQKTGASYIRWIKPLIRFYKSRHPRELSGEDVKAFLTHLVVKEKVAASTQNQTLS